MHEEQGRKVETAVEARGAYLDRPVLMVLIVSLCLIGVLYGAIYFGYFGS